MKNKVRHLFDSAAHLRKAITRKVLLPAGWQKIKQNLPKGDGHPVLMFPGILAHDVHMVSLRRCIAESGYKVYGWENGINRGLNDKSLANVRDHLQKIFIENGRRKVTLIGHSLGGILARELAREFPEMVRDVVTIGSPFGGLGQGKKGIPRHLLFLHKYLNPDTAHLIRDEDMAKRLLTPPPVPTTAIFSKRDRVVGWKACLNPETPQSENLEIRANHLTMLFSPAVAVILLDRLSVAEGKWTPFAPQDYTFLSYPRAPEEKDIPGDPGWSGEIKPLFKKKPPAI